METEGLFLRHQIAMSTRLEIRADVVFANLMKKAGVNSTSAGRIKYPSGLEIHTFDCAKHPNKTLKISWMAEVKDAKICTAWWLKVVNAQFFST